jgi:hypothetical protein
MKTTIAALIIVIAMLLLNENLNKPKPPPYIFLAPITEGKCDYGVFTVNKGNISFVDSVSFNIGKKKQEAKKEVQATQTVDNVASVK